MKTLLRYPLLLALAAMVMAGCHHRNTPQPEPPQWEAEANLQGGSPLWQVAEDTKDITSRMYVTVALGDTVGPADRLAAFCGEECVGTASPVGSPAGYRFYMVVNRPQDAAVGRITLAYYSAAHDQVGYWRNLFAFEQDAILGTADEPLHLTADRRRSYPMSIDVACSLPASIEAAEGDKMAVFAGDRCRVAINPLNRTGREGYDYAFELPLSGKEETVEFRYWQAATGKTFTASGVVVRLADTVLTLSPVPFK